MSLVIETAHADDIQLWTIDHPSKRNALDQDLVQRLRGAVRSAESTHVRVVVITGAGTSFCAGADLRHLYQYALRSESPRPFLETICALTVEIEQSPVVFLAALNGHAVAGGFELALACDIVLAARGALVGDGHVRHNLVPGGGSSVRIERRLGASTATWLALSGELAPVETLAATGWIHSLTAPADLLPTAIDLAQRLTGVPRPAQALFKKLLNGRPEPTEADLSAELDAFDAHWLSNDISSHLEGFVEKKPQHHA